MKFTKEMQIGKGSSRTVYAVSDKEVIKRVHGKEKRVQRGLAQNRAEYDIYRYGTQDHGVTHLCPIFDLSPDDEILRMGRAMQIDDVDKIPDGLRDSVKLFKRYLTYIYDVLYRCRRHEIKGSIKKYRKYYADRPIRLAEFNTMLKSKLFKDILVLVYDYELMLGDIKRLSSWGYYKGKFVLIDYGATKTVLEDYYDRQFSRGIAV